MRNVNEERTSFRSTVNEWKNTIYNYERKFRTEYYNREMWACDPNGYKSLDGKDSFVEVLLPYQGFISNEIGLNSNRNCRQSCSDYKSTRQFVCKENSLCPSSGNYAVKRELLCKGSVEKCIRMPFDMEVCVAVRKNILNISLNENVLKNYILQPSNSTRRYDFIKYNGDGVIGVERNCDRQINLVSYWNWLYKCDNCFCYCNEEGIVKKTFKVDIHFL